MGAVLVQTVTGGNAASSGYTVGISGVATGNTLVVFVGAAQTISTPTDGTNTYTAVGTTLNFFSNNRMNIWYAKNVTGGNLTLTLGFGGTVGSGVTIREYSGLDLTSPFDVTNTGSGSNSIPTTSATSTTTQADELVVAMMSSNATYTGSAGSGYGHYLDNNTSTVSAVGVEDKIIAATGAQTGVFGTSTVFNWGAIVATFRIASTAPVVTSWKQPVNQPRLRRMKAILVYPEMGLLSATTTTQTITAVANIIGYDSFDPELWKQPVNQPLRHRWIKRQQPNYADAGKFLVTATTTQTITAVANIRGLVTVDVGAWKQPVNQPLRSRVPKRQQPNYNDRGRYLSSLTTTQTITAMARITATTLQSITAKANITALTVVDVASWKQPTNQPLKARVPKRLQLPRTQRSQFVVTSSTTQTITALARITGTTLQSITAKANIKALVAIDVTAWKQPTNQPLRSRVPKRLQLPRPTKGSFLVTVTTIQINTAIARITGTTLRTITARANIIGYPAVNPELWIHATNQPLRSRVPKRMQTYRPFPTGSLFFTTTTKTITAKANIRGITTTNVATWKQPVNQFLRKRVPKRQQPTRTPVFSTATVFTVTTRIITAKASISSRSLQTITARAHIFNPFLWIPTPPVGATSFVGVTGPSSGFTPSGGAVAGFSDVVTSLPPVFVPTAPVGSDPWTFIDH